VSPFLYLLTQCIVIPRYLRLVVVPWGFNVDHDVPLVPGWTSSVAVGFAFLMLLLGFGIYALRRWPLVGFGIIWCFLALGVESSFLPIQDAMVEHRMYLAMPGIALVVGVAFAAGWRRMRAATLVIGGAVAVSLCTLTFLRNELWREPIRLWEDALVQSPRKARVYANLGATLHHAGRLDEAIAHYCQALKIDPESHQAQTNAYTAMAEKMEQDLENNPVPLENLEIKEDGTVELDVPNPCTLRKPSG
jgi:tetratricopeptide (TPR) repeat protein